MSISLLYKHPIPFLNTWITAYLKKKPSQFNLNSISIQSHFIMLINTFLNSVCSKSFHVSFNVYNLQTIFPGSQEDTIKHTRMAYTYSIYSSAAWGARDKIIPRVSDWQKSNKYYFLIIILYQYIILIEHCSEFSSYVVLSYYSVGPRTAGCAPVYILNTGFHQHLDHWLGVC